MSKNYDCIILGCTHYCFLKTVLEKMSNKIIINGNNGISRHLYNLYQKQYKKSKINPQNSTVKFVFSENNQYLKQKYKKILNQILAKKHFI